MARNVVVLKGNPREEGSIAIGSAITPGMIVEPAAGGHQKHSADGGHVAPLVLVRENHEKEGAGPAVDIAQNDSMTVIYPQPGDVVNVPCEAGVSARDLLTSKGNGKFKERVAESGAPILAVALTAVADGRCEAVIVGGGAAVDISV